MNTPHLAAPAAAGLPPGAMLLRLGAASGLVDVGAARSGRRIGSPHAPAAAPLLSRGACRHGAAMHSEIPEKLSRWLPLKDACFAFGEGRWVSALAHIMLNDSAAGAPGASFQLESWAAAIDECQRWLRESVQAGGLEVRVSGRGAMEPDLLLPRGWGADISLELPGWHLSRNDERIRNALVRRTGWMPLSHALLAFASDEQLVEFRAGYPSLMSRPHLRMSLEASLFDHLSAGRLMGRGVPMLVRSIGRFIPPTSPRVETAMGGLGPAALPHYDGLSATPVGPAVALASTWWTIDRYDPNMRLLAADSRSFGDLGVNEAAAILVSDSIAGLLSQSFVRDEQIAEEWLSMVASGAARSVHNAMTQMLRKPERADIYKSGGYENALRRIEKLALAMQKQRKR